MTIAEESTAWPQVTRPPWLGGLGFSFKWNMGWMHYTLEYFKRDPVHRKYHQNDLTFAMIYHYHENFILRLSHDRGGARQALAAWPEPGDDCGASRTCACCLATNGCSPVRSALLGGEIGQSSGGTPMRRLNGPCSKPARITRASSNS